MRVIAPILANEAALHLRCQLSECELVVLEEDFRLAPPTSAITRETQVVD